MGKLIGILFGIGASLFILIESIHAYYFFKFPHLQKLSFGELCAWGFGHNFVYLVVIPVCIFFILVSIVISFLIVASGQNKADAIIKEAEKKETLAKTKLADLKREKEELEAEYRLKSHRKSVEVNTLREENARLKKKLYGRKVKRKNRKKIDRFLESVPLETLETMQGS